MRCTDVDPMAFPSPAEPLPIPPKAPEAQPDLEERSAEASSYHPRPCMRQQNADRDPEDDAARDEEASAVARHAAL